MNAELQVKLGRIRDLMVRYGWDGVLLGRNENFCWLSCGHNAFVDKSSQNAVVKLLITAQEQYVFANASEQFRIPEEELNGLGFQRIAFPWDGCEEDALRPYVEGKCIASDCGAFDTPDHSAEIGGLRSPLTPEEIARYREIGPLCAGIVEDCCREISPCDTEYQIAGNVTGKLMALGFQVPVCLIAADERLLKYRHPLPVGARVKDRAMIAICAQKYGLTISMSRIVCFTPLDAETQKKYDALLKIDATYILNTTAGARAGEIVQKAHQEYAQSGYEADFHLHHQGGALGYLTRDYCANEANQSMVLDGQAFSWNPTIAGVKCEDTYLVFGDRQEILSDTGNWVYRDVSVDGKTVRRPLILIKPSGQC
ncbi:MAG: M24 family metallopeptidase [Candidatus Limiplasma sp.]|nr:M24 family metallopeptidase [Candidatus Limiplasma sp.]